jgi:hypothetical protein
LEGARTNHCSQHRAFLQHRERWHLLIVEGEAVRGITDPKEVEGFFDQHPQWSWDSDTLEKALELLNNLEKGDVPFCFMAIPSTFFY